jgi:hypothetical protein
MHRFAVTPEAHVDARRCSPALVRVTPWRNVLERNFRGALADGPQPRGESRYPQSFGLNTISTRAMNGMSVAMPPHIFHFFNAA